MIQIIRLTEPAILVTKKALWTSKFISSGNPRPSHSQYGHRDVKTLLYGASFYKCYYCERPLKDNEKEIDHLIEVSERKDLAFEWTNLYLACDNCNGKVPNRVIPVTDALNPCTSSNAEIEAAICFEDEQIKAVGGSEIGLTSIIKYKLDSDLLDRLRAKRLNVFFKECLAIKHIQVIEGRVTYTVDEQRTIRRYANPDQPFSLMFKPLIKAMGITL